MPEAPDVDLENAHSQHLHREDQNVQRSAANAQIIAHRRRLRREDHTARRSAAAIKISSQVPPAASAPAPVPVPAPVPPIVSHVTRSQGTVCAEALTASATDPCTYVEAMQSSQHDHWKRAMGEESSSHLLNNTFSALNSREAGQLQVQPIGSKWVYQTKHNPDRTTQYKARQVIQ
jgi:hypothetical protein